jgi:hypothetical protein
MRGENIAIDGKRASRRHTRFIRALKDHRAKHAHLCFEQAMRVGCLSALECVRANQLGQSISVMRRSFFHRPHLVNHDAMTALG